MCGVTHLPTVLQKQPWPRLQSELGRFPSGSVALRLTSCLSLEAPDLVSTPPEALQAAGFCCVWGLSFSAPWEEERIGEEGMSCDQAG